MRNGRDKLGLMADEFGDNEVPLTWVRGLGRGSDRSLPCMHRHETYGNELLTMMVKEANR